MKTHQIQQGETIYIFQAAILCEQCGGLTRFELESEGLAPKEPENEETYDSDDFPKGPFQAEQVETCDRMDRCLNLQEGARSRRRDL